MSRFLLALLVCLCGAPLLAQSTDGEEFSPLTKEQRTWFRNPDGSCVQCSIGMCGVNQNLPEATYLLWDTEYGPKVRGGSNPTRVEHYCDVRGIPAYNITGKETYDWMRWASKTGRTCAIGCFPVHFQTLVYHNDDPKDPKPWKVCNNNSPTRIDQYTDSQFRYHHESSGKWVVILKTPPPPPKPLYVVWWN